MENKILIVEDDEMVCRGIVDALQLRNWETETVDTFADALKRIREHKYILYILDMKLPDGNGITLCREIRKHTNNPVLFLSAYDSENYIVEGFEAGGNDYVIKPFRTFELLARIKSLLKHSETFSECKSKVGIKSGNYFLDINKQSFYQEKALIDLTLTEYRILHALITGAPRLIERTKLLEIVWDSNENYVDDNTLSVYINRIRKKIMDTSSESPIETKRGVGYRWTLETEDIYETISKKSDY